MRRKYLLSITALLLGCLLLSACAPHDAAETEPSQAQTSAAESTLPPTETDVELVVYAPDSSASGFVENYVTVPQLDADTILSQLIALEVLPQDCAIVSFDASQGSALTLDLTGSFASHLGSMGSSGEYVILGSVVNTFLTAYNAETITITVDGQVLETGHNVYDAPLEFFS